MTRDFSIAECRFRIEGEGWEPFFGPFGRALHRFEVPVDPQAETVLVLRTDGMPEEPAPDFDACTVLDTFDFPDAEAVCRLMVDKSSRILTIQREDRKTLWFRLARKDGAARSNLKELPGDEITGSLIRMGMWFLYGMAVAPRHIFLIHASVICCGEGAALFLGESGTGKSTHTRLWREHIPGAELLNDDSPAVRLTDGLATVYGTPWSGKTPCYRPERRAIRGFVRLSQAPQNVIRPLHGIRAVGALLPSAPPSFAYDAELQDAVCETIAELIARVPVCHLACLPDAEAARLSHRTLFGPEQEA